MLPGSDPAVRKRSSDDTGTAPPASPAEGDHRKKRRNRTTQSCLNCHTSKRMCDRRRPACARCTQLGLTGLCVYEVDDPNQRGTHDETARLITRVAELESVIREIKNKPHPRWLQSGSQPSQTTPDKWIHKSNQRLSRDDSHSLSRSSSPSSPPTSDDHSEKSPLMGQLPHPRSVLKVTNTYPLVAVENQASVRSPFCQSPQSTPSPLLSTLIDEYSHQNGGISNGMPHDCDLTTMLFSYPPLVNCGDDYIGLSKDGLQGYAHHAIQSEPCHCGCVGDPSTYNVLLELSLRLRKAVDIMLRNHMHHTGANCHLHRLVVDLDRYVSNTLGNVAPSTAPANNLPPFSNPSYRPNYNTGQSWGLSHHSSSPPQDELLAIRWASPARTRS